MAEVRDGVAEGFDDVKSQPDFPDIEGHGKIGYSAILVATAAALQIISLLLLIVSYCLTSGLALLKADATYSKMGGPAVQHAELWRGDAMSGGNHTPPPPPWHRNSVVLGRFLPGPLPTWAPSVGSL